VVNHLQASVAIAPDWVANHQLLSIVLSERGRHADALYELDGAIDNVIEPDSAWDLPAREFERSISARAAPCANG
jgi:hypothetical protein